MEHHSIINWAKGALTIIAFVLCTGPVNAQNGCGTEPYKDPWLTSFQKRIDLLDRFESNDTLLRVPMVVHVLGNDDGSGYFPVSRILQALCRVNQDFESTNIQFYLKENIQYIDHSGWYDHPDIHAGAEMMFVNNYEAAINCYIVQDPAGNCGYNLPYAGIALSKSCLGPRDHTWAHEIGHNLSLPHPFLGWEGGRTHDGSQPPVFNQPAPEWITYDYTLFKDVYYPDTMIIDTAIVEKTDGSNCRESSDGFCDTKPDYIAFRWPCGIDSFSNIRQLDPDTNSFKSDGRWIMSYSFDNCNRGFTPEQIMAMRANLKEQKPELLRETPPDVVVSEPVALLYPENGTDVPANNIVLEWSPLDSGTFYLVEASRLSNFGFLEVEVVTDATTLVIDQQLGNRKYYWRVIPFSASSFCSGNASVRTFTVQTPTSNRESIPGDVAIYSNNGYVHVESTALDLTRCDVKAIALDGRMIGLNKILLSEDQIILEVLNSPKGIGILSLETEGRNINFKLLLDQ